MKSVSAVRALDHIMMKRRVAPTAAKRVKLCYESINTTYATGRQPSALQNNSDSYNIPYGTHKQEKPLYSVPTK